MQDLRVTIVQANQLWEDKSGNLKHYSDLLKDCELTDLILFPEMFQTGFTMNAPAMAETMETSEGISWLKNLAQEKNSAVYTSIIINENGKFYNRGVFVFPNGEITIYDKRKRFAMAGEDQVYHAGSEEKIVDYKGWKINLQICYDLRFPEQCRNELLEEAAKYDLLLYVANWPERRILHWSTLLRARAIENQCYVVGVNRVGEDAMNLNYNGSSAVFSALGEEFSNLPPNTESVQQIVLSYDLLHEVRDKLPFLKDKTCRLF